MPQHSAVDSRRIAFSPERCAGRCCQDWRPPCQPCGGTSRLAGRPSHMSRATKGRTRRHPCCDRTYCTCPARLRRLSTRAYPPSQRHRCLRGLLHAHICEHGLGREEREQVALQIVRLPRGSRGSGGCLQHAGGCPPPAGCSSTLLQSSLNLRKTTGSVHAWASAREQNVASLWGQQGRSCRAGCGSGGQCRLRRRSQVPRRHGGGRPTSRAVAEDGPRDTAVGPEVEATAAFAASLPPAPAATPAGRFACVVTPWPQAATTWEGTSSWVSRGC